VLRVENGAGPPNVEVSNLASTLEAGGFEIINGDLLVIRRRMSRSSEPPLLRRTWSDQIAEAFEFEKPKRE
jgi:hypothetical protein